MKEETALTSFSLTGVKFWRGKKFLLFSFYVGFSPAERVGR